MEKKSIKLSLLFLRVYWSLKPIFLNRKRAIPAPWGMLILGEVHFLVTEKNRGVTSLQTGYLWIVRFKYTIFSIVALNFWSHGHRMNFGCSSVIAGWLLGGFHWYFVMPHIWVLVLDQAWLNKCVHNIFVEMGFCAWFFKLLVLGVGLSDPLAQ